jgi:hypothetical protein
MKKNPPNTPIDLTQEELQKLVEALKAFQLLGKEKEQYDELFTAASREIESFALTGDLRNVDKVSTMLVSQAQANLAERRLVNVGQRLAESEQALDQEAAVVARLIETALYQVRNGHVEKVSRSLQEHFADVQEARRQAFQSKVIRELDERIYSFKNLPNALEGESIAVANEYLKLAPTVFAEVEEIKAALGGSIPSESELRGV